MTNLATHYVPSSRIPLLVTRLSELETSDLRVIAAAIEEFVDDPIPLETWTSWRLGNDNRAVIDECFAKDTLEEIVSALASNVRDWD